MSIPPGEVLAASSLTLAAAITAGDFPPRWRPAVWAPENVEEVEEAPGAVVAIEQRRVVAVQVTLPGPAEPLLRVGGIEPQAHPGGLRLMVHIANEGRGLTSGAGVLEVFDPALEQTFEFGTFVPGTAITCPCRGATTGSPRASTSTGAARLRDVDRNLGGHVHRWRGHRPAARPLLRGTAGYPVVVVRRCCGRLRAGRSPMGNPPAWPTHSQTTSAATPQAASTTTCATTAAELEQPPAAGSGRG